MTLFDFIGVHPAQADARPRAITTANVIENYSHLQYEGVMSRKA
jgi:hypothetical protein